MKRNTTHSHEVRGVSGNYTRDWILQIIHVPTDMVLSAASFFVCLFVRGIYQILETRTWTSRAGRNPENIGGPPEIGKITCFRRCSMCIWREGNGCLECLVYAWRLPVTTGLVSGLLNSLPLRKSRSTVIIRDLAKIYLGLGDTTMDVVEREGLGYWSQAPGIRDGVYITA